MINEIPKILINIALVFGAVLLMSAIGVSLMLLGEKLFNKWKERRKHKLIIATSLPPKFINEDKGLKRRLEITRKEEKK